MERIVTPEEVAVLLGNDTYSESGFIKDDNKVDKIAYDLFPVEFIEKIGIVLDFGAKKYAPENWRKVNSPEDIARIRSALMRHWIEYKKDPDALDEETGFPHIWHAGCCMVFLVSLSTAEKVVPCTNSDYELVRKPDNA